jgi:imidazolonepropionase-like amidohydrolase
MYAVRATRAFDGSQFIEGGATVLVDGEHIVGVEGGGFEVPDGVPLTTYDGTLLPGLVDTHVHLVAASTLAGTPGSLERAPEASPEELDEIVLAGLAAQVVAGVTTVRDLGDVGYRTLHHRDLGTPGRPRIVAAGPPITVAEGHCHYLGGVVTDDASIDAAMAERVERGVDVVKVMASGGFLTPGSDQLGVQFSAEQLRRVVEGAHRAGLRVVAHTHSRVAAQVAVEAGVDGLEHFTNLAAGVTGVTEELLDLVAAAGVTVGPTLGSDLAAFPPPDQVPPHVVALLASVGVLDRDEFFAQRGAETGRLRERGIRVVSGLDAGVGPFKRHGGLWRAVADLVVGGWPVDEAVATATSVAAEECGVAAGRLAAGLAADLLVVDGDLAADVTALSRPVAVWARGIPVPLD